MPTAEGNAGDDAGDDAAEQTWRERRNQYPLPPEFRVATELLELPTVRVDVTGRNWFISLSRAIRLHDSRKLDDSLGAVELG